MDTVAYGGIVFDKNGRVLLRKPKGEFDGYKWTFAKGRPQKGETPEEAALREVLEETGFACDIIERIPGSFKGGTTDNIYFIMRFRASKGKPDEETEEVDWVNIDKARTRIAESTNVTGRKRDLDVFDAAIEHLQYLVNLELSELPPNLLGRAKAIHKVICKMLNATPMICAPNSTRYIRYYSIHPDLFHFEIYNKKCELLISTDLGIGDVLEKAGIQSKTRGNKWDIVVYDEHNVANFKDDYLRKILMNVSVNDIIDNSVSEGALKRIYKNHYERKKKLRDMCIALHGYRCCVCKMSFEERYGIEYKRLIHIHHEEQLSHHAKEHNVDPKNDLKPVCPNCHFVIHSHDPPLTIERAKKMIDKNVSADIGYGIK